MIILTNENLTDFEIVQACLNGDKDIFRELIVRYKGLVYSIILRMVSNSSDYNDLAQEIFIKAYKNLSKYQPSYSFATWLIRITTNHIIDYRRKNKVEYVPLDAAEYYLSSSGSAEEQVILKDSKIQMEKLIDELPEIYRLPIVLYHHQGLSYDEIAKSLDLPISKVKNRIFRGRKILQEGYKKYLKE